MIIGQFVVTSSNSSKSQTASCRVKKDGVTIALMYFGSRSNCLGYIRSNPQSKERLEFVRTLKSAGLSDEDVHLILSKSR